MGESRLIEQAYRFALAPTPEQERFLAACAGASRFFYNWGLALVETRLRLRRAYGPSVAVPWSYKELCSEFAKVKPCGRRGNAARLCRAPPGPPAVG